VLRQSYLSPDLGRPSSIALPQIEQGPWHIPPYVMISPMKEFFEWLLLEEVHSYFLVLEIVSLPLYQLYTTTVWKHFARLDSV
jgi:hypothetical protein